MKYDEFLALAGSQPVFETGLLLAGDVDPTDVRRQLSRWVQGRAGDPVAARAVYPGCTLPANTSPPLPDRQFPVTRLLRQPAICTGLLWIDPGICGTDTQCNHPTPGSLAQRTG